MYVKKKNPCIESYVGFHLVLLFLTEPWSENLSKRKDPMPFVFSPSSATITLYYCQFGLFGSGALHQAFFGSEWIPF